MFTAWATYLDAKNFYLDSQRLIASVFGCIAFGGAAAAGSGSGGAAAGCVTGYKVVGKATAAPYTALVALNDVKGVLAVGMADVFAGNTGWDPELQRLVFGGDTQVSIVTTGSNAVITDPFFSWTISSTQLAWDINRLVGSEPGFELQMADQPGNRGLWGFMPASFSWTTP